MTIESRYTLASTLEHGRFGVLYRAVDSLRAASSDGDDDVVVWVLPPEFAHHGPARVAFLRDLERVRGLAHPNIARVLDIGQDADRLFVVTEWTDGDTLRNVIDALGSERLEVGEADTIIEDIGSALAYAHDHHIVHGDVRAENITVSSDHRIKVANFMLASLARSTPFAPALLDDTRALAVLAHELYCGVPPSRDVNARLIRQIPRQRRKAIAMAMTAGNGHHPLSVADFLAHAGLMRDGYRLPPREGEPPVAARRFSLWRIALPVVGLVAIGTALQVGVDGTRPPPAAPSVLSAEGETTAAQTAAASRNEAGSPDSLAPAPPDATGSTAAQSAPTMRVEQPPHEDPGAAPQSDLAGSSVPSAAVTAVAAVAPAAASTRSRSTEAIERLTLSGYTVTVQEDQGTARLDISRTANLARELDFVWWTTDGTARADDDYASFGARIESFRPNEAVRSIHIPLVADAVAEGPESFFVHVSADRRVGLERRPTVTAEIRIIDDDL